jgi:AraC-like DNA-binding protein
MEPQPEPLRLLQVRRVHLAGVIEGAVPWAIRGAFPHQALMRVRGAPCWVSHPRRDPVGVKAEDGDLVLLLEDTLGATVSDLLGSTPASIRERDTAYEEWPILRPLRFGGNGVTTRLPGASFEFDDLPQSVRARLRGMIVIPSSAIAGEPMLSHLLDAFEAEVSERRDAQPLVVARLIESILVLALRCERRHAHAAVAAGAAEPARPAPHPDRYVDKAVCILQETPRGDWSVGSLASVVGLSRRSFTRRFATELGEAPGEHLTRRRMELATHLLRTTDLDVGEVARRVGYESGAAFCRAFKRRHGVSPNRFRKSADP